MAGDEDLSSDSAQEKYFTCHPNSKVSFVICVICDNVYHASDFKKIKNTKYLSNVLVICPKHPDCDITSTHDPRALNDTARKVIAQVKLFEKDQVEKKLLHNISVNVASDNVERQNLTVCGQEEDVFSDLRAEVNLLRILNGELQDKNLLLKELLEKTKNELAEKKRLANTNTFSYATSLQTYKQPKEHVPSIIVKAKTEAMKAKIKRTVTDKLMTDIIMPVKQIKETKDGKMIIKCTRKEDAITMEEKLIEKIGDNYHIQQEEIDNPRLKVVGIENNMKREEIEHDLNDRNFNNTDMFCTVIHAYTTKKNTMNAIIEVTSDTYKYIRDNKNKLFIGHQCCRVYDDLNITPCNKCGRVGHNSKKCNNNTICLRCAGKHETNKCKINYKIRCANCIYSNTTFNTSRDINHTAIDAEKCEYLKYLINRKLRKTDYPITPVLPSKFGYISEPRHPTANNEDQSENNSKNDKQDTTQNNTIPDDTGDTTKQNSHTKIQPETNQNKGKGRGKNTAKNINL